MKVLITGDFCPRYRVAEMFEARRYEEVLREIRPIATGADYSLVNLECPIGGPKEDAIAKKGPNLSCNETSFLALPWMGFRAVTLANNHFYDYGQNGVKRTLDMCRKHGLDHVGGGQLNYIAFS